MQFILMNYVQERGFGLLQEPERERWIGAYRAYIDAMNKADVLKSSSGLANSSSARTVRVSGDEAQVMDGPYADSKEQLGGYHVIEVPDLDAALRWAAQSPTALHGVVEVRALSDNLK